MLHLYKIWTNLMFYSFFFFFEAWLLLGCIWGSSKTFRKFFWLDLGYSCVAFEFVSTVMKQKGFNELIKFIYHKVCFPSLESAWKPSISSRSSSIELLLCTVMLGLIDWCHPIFQSFVSKICVSREVMAWLFGEMKVSPCFKFATTIVNFFKK